jgi:anaerobic ribonucleoside-triphosphate reductase
MEKKMTKKEIEDKIGLLKTQLENIEGQPILVYQRITGYYRATVNWNIGKRAEYEDRVVFSLPKSKE